MDKDTGFIDWGRVVAPKRDRGERIGDFREFYLDRTLEEIQRQGGRCMDCGVPFCQQGCPLGNMMPDWNGLIYENKWKAAYQFLASTNNFPEFTGRLCPAPCEPACVLAINDDAVTIEQNEREIIERAFLEGWVVPRIPKRRTGKNIAIVGSGPAGMAGAAQLNQVGHHVTLYEKSDRIGGLLRYGIPDYKLEKAIIDRRLDILEAEGVTFETGVNVGVDITWAALHERNDAVLITIGAGKPRDIAIPGRELDGVHFAMAFLEQQNRRGAGDKEAEKPVHAKGKNVVILGGGDTGADCLGTAHRQGATSVRQLEFLPTPPDARMPDNPWPQWPMTFRVSSSLDEGGEMTYAVQTQRLTGRGGIRKLHAVQLQPKRRSGGWAAGFEEKPGSAFSVAADLLIIAIGFTGPVTDTLSEQLGVKINARGAIAVDDSFETNVAGVYAAGDAMRGANLIVRAISDGREAARAIDLRLRGAAAWLPTRGDDQHFGGR
jgi:glutamate synthase (NADPH/NADH) small chain